MFQATNTNIAASAASGTWAASGAAISTIASKVAACTMPASGDAAPERTLVVVRAMVPVAGMPPKNGVMKLATPCAINSWLGSWRSSIMPSATRAHSSDSIAHSSAMVTVGATRLRADSQLKAGTWNAGSPVGRPPNLEAMVSTGRPVVATTMVASARAMMLPGRRATKPVRLPDSPSPERLRSCARRGQNTITASDPTAMATACNCAVCRFSPSARIRPKKSAGIFSMRRPRKSLICDSAISTAMPLVKPMMMATGMKRISEPTRVRPMMNSSTPAMMVESSRLARP